MLAKATNYFKNHLWITPVLLGFVLRLYQLSTSSIWHDEGYTMWLIRYGLKDIITRTARDVHPPGYYLIAKVWVTIFGNSVFSIRLLSLIFSVGIIYFLYKLVELIWDEKAAFWASMFIAFSPFMIRFGQEARMYGVVAFFTTLATYFLFRFIKEKKYVYLYLYIPAMLIAMYTQYYAFFVIISHWLIMAIYTPEFWNFHWIKAIKEKIGVFNYKWWLANVALLFFYLPWFPVAYKQVTRVSGSYWIKPEWITIRTIPNNILQFVTYTHFDKIFYSVKFGNVIYWLVVALLVGSGIYLFIKRDKIKESSSILIFGYLPMILVFTLSKLKTPVYQDRYFPFSAIALFAIWGIAVSMITNKKIRIATASAALIVLTVGIYIMHGSTFHGMLQLKNTYETNKKPGDAVMAGELYTFLDGTYYFGDKNIKFMSNSVDGYGESSLFYDQQKEYLVTQDEAKLSSNRIWIVGKKGDKDYYNQNLWSGWTAKTYYEGSDSNVLKLVLYTKN